jgi:hypothetical protein
MGGLKIPAIGAATSLSRGAIEELAELSLYLMLSIENLNSLDGPLAAQVLLDCHSAQGAVQRR